MLKLSGGARWHLNWAYDKYERLNWQKKKQSSYVLGGLRWVPDSQWPAQYLT